MRAAKWVVPAVMWVVSFGRETGGGKERVVGERERERGSWVRVPVVSSGCQCCGGRGGSMRNASGEGE